MRCDSCQRDLPPSSFSGAQKKKANRGFGCRCTECVDGKKSPLPALRLGERAELTGLTDELVDLNGSCVTLISQDHDNCQVKHEKLPSHAREDVVVRYIVVKAENLVRIVHCSRCCERVNVSTMVTCSGCKVRQYCSLDCKNEDWNAGAHGVECRLRQPTATWRVREGRRGEIIDKMMQASSSKAGELLHARLSAFMLIADLRELRKPVAWLTFTMRRGRPPLCRLDALDQREVRPRMEQLGLSQGEAGIVHALQVIDRNCAYGDLTAMCLDVDDDGHVTSTLKTIKEFERMWAGYRCDPTYFGSRGAIRKKAPADRAVVIDALVREGFGGYLYRCGSNWTRHLPSLADKATKSASLQMVTFEMRRSTVQRMETFGAVVDPNHFLKACEGVCTLEGEEEYLANCTVRAAHEAAKQAIREQRSGSASDAAHANARATALRHEGNDAIKAGDASGARGLYSRAIDLLVFAARSESLLSLALCLSNRAEAHLRLGRLTEALEDVEDASEFLSRVDARTCAAMMAKLEARRKRALETVAAREATIAMQERELAEREDAARARAEDRQRTLAEVARSTVRPSRQERRRAASAETRASGGELPTDVPEAATERGHHDASERTNAEAEEEQAQRALDAARVAALRVAEAQAAEAQAAEAQAAEAQAAEAQAAEAQAAVERSVAAERRREVVERRRAQRRARQERRLQEAAAREAAIEAERRAAIERAALADLAATEREQREARIAVEEELAYADELREREQERHQTCTMSGVPVSAEEDDDECPICMLDDGRPMCKPCGSHSLHVSCAIKWRQQCRSGQLNNGVAQDATCPMCRVPI
jgi:hypothetical protein